MFEMLASVLGGGADPGARARPGKAHAPYQNTAILAIDIETFRPLARFCARCRRARGDLKALPRQAGFDEIFCPANAPTHRSGAPQIRHSDPGEALDRT